MVSVNTDHLTARWIHDRKLHHRCQRRWVRSVVPGAERNLRTDFRTLRVGINPSALLHQYCRWSEVPRVATVPTPSAKSQKARSQHVVRGHIRKGGDYEASMGSIWA